MHCLELWLGYRSKNTENKTDLLHLLFFLWDMNYDPVRLQSLRLGERLRFGMDGQISDGRGGGQIFHTRAEAIAAC